MRSSLAASILLPGLPAAASACAVCFGRAEGAGWARGFTWGLVVLLGATFAILAVMVGAVARIERLKDEADRRASNPAS